MDRLMQTYICVVSWSPCNQLIVWSKTLQHIKRHYKRRRNEKKRIEWITRPETRSARASGKECEFCAKALWEPRPYPIPSYLFISDPIRSLMANTIALQYLNACAPFTRLKRIMNVREEWEDERKCKQEGAFKRRGPHSADPSPKEV